MSERADEHIQDVPALRFREGGMAPAGGTRIAEYKVLENTDKARTLAEPWKREPTWRAAVFSATACPI